MRREPRNVQQRVMRALMRGLTIICEKTKEVRSGGKMQVSVGPYKTAVRGSLPPYSFITTGRYRASHRQWSFGTAIEAAQDFILFVGRDIAWRAVITAERNAEDQRRKGS